ncbi:MAG: serine hydrolase [Bacilli bacterium]|nr:serine hydrolase [Bacilli bacterium]
MSIKTKINKILSECKYDIGLYIKDYKGNVIKYNENKVYETASCIKVFVLIEYFKQIFENKINKNDSFTYTKSDNKLGLNSGIMSSFDYGLKLTTKDYATLMIIYSDNIATNKLINYLGIDNINKTIKELGFNHTYLYNELDLVKYLKFGRTTAYEYAKVYDMLLNNKIINEEVSKNCLNILKKQKYNDMITKYIPPMDLIFKGKENVVEGANVSKINYIASKSGSIVWTDDTMKNARNDGGIISTIYGDYIISIFISDIDDLTFNINNKGLDVGAKINKFVYESFTQNKGELK